MDIIYQVLGKKAAIHVTTEVSNKVRYKEYWKNLPRKGNETRELRMGRVGFLEQEDQTVKGVEVRVRKWMQRRAA